MLIQVEKNVLFEKCKKYVDQTFYDKNDEEIVLFTNRIIQLYRETFGQYQIVKIHSLFVELTSTHSSCCNGIHIHGISVGETMFCIHLDDTNILKSSLVKMIYAIKSIKKRR